MKSIFTCLTLLSIAFLSFGQLTVPVQNMTARYLTSNGEMEPSTAELAELNNLFDGSEATVVSPSNRVINNGYIVFSFDKSYVISTINFSESTPECAKRGIDFDFYDEADYGAGILALISGNYELSAQNYCKSIILTFYIDSSACTTTPTLSSIKSVSLFGDECVSVFTLGNTSTRSKGAGKVTYSVKTCQTYPIVTYSISPSNNANISINSNTGEVTYTSGWEGDAIITAISTREWDGATVATYTHTATTKSAKWTYWGEAITSDNKVGVGTTTIDNDATLQVAGNVKATKFIANGTELKPSQWDTNTDGSIDFQNGTVAIGTSASPDAMLTVKGKVIASEVEIRNITAIIPDYVFANGYNLKPLHEVENYIKTNKHLPEVPSEKEFKENGMCLVEMNTTLLKKVEELTLYMIELKKENESLKSRIEKLEK